MILTPCGRRQPGWCTVSMWPLPAWLVYSQHVTSARMASVPAGVQSAARPHTPILHLEPVIHLHLRNSCRQYQPEYIQHQKVSIDTLRNDLCDQVIDLSVVQQVVDPDGTYDEVNDTAIRVISATQPGCAACLFNPL